MSNFALANSLGDCEPALQTLTIWLRAKHCTRKFAYGDREPALLTLAIWLRAKHCTRKFAYGDREPALHYDY